MATFEPGLDLSRAFYREAVAPRIGVPHAAALLGEGSEVLGFDQERSTDHQWGPRLQVFVAEDDVNAVSSSIECGLPPSFHGWPTRFFDLARESDEHHVQVTTLHSWMAEQLGLDSVSSLPPARWLALPQQHLLQATEGAVFHDDTGELTEMRSALAWYPKDVWLWMVASQWHLIGNCEPLIGRTVEAGDARGARLVAGRLARLLMEMCFLQEKRYRPYDKWFGSAFRRLDAASTLGCDLDTLIDATDAKEREAAGVRALEAAAQRHNSLRLTEPVDPTCREFDVGINAAIRPYQVLNAGRFVRSCTAKIIDPTLRGLAPTGSIDQLTHADDALINFTEWPQRLHTVYEALTR